MQFNLIWFSWSWVFYTFYTSNQPIITVENLPSASTQTLELMPGAWQRYPHTSYLYFQPLKGVIGWYGVGWFYIDLLHQKKMIVIMERKGVIMLQGAGWTLQGFVASEQTLPEEQHLGRGMFKILGFKFTCTFRVFSHSWCLFPLEIDITISTIFTGY